MNSVVGTFADVGRERACFRSATAISLLLRRAWDRAIRTEDAAIAVLGLEPYPAVLAVVEELAGVGEHLLDNNVTAVRAGDRGL